MTDLTIQQKKDWAKVLYLKESLLQKEIAGRVGVSEKTIGKWINDEKWEDLRTACFITKEEQIRRAYKMIDALLTEIEEKQKGIPNTGQADVLSKLTAAINSLETETNIAQITDVAREFINWLKPQDLPKAQDFISYLDGFIKHKLKTA
jgi:transcriptional regulator with XRE-family HTH domain